MDVSLWISTAFGAALLGSLVFAAGQFDNHLWRVICIFASSNVLSKLALYNESPWYLGWIVFLVISASIWWIPHLRPKYKRSGCVVVTGADSGMGQETVLQLADTNDNSEKGSYDIIFAAALNAKEAKAKLEELCYDKSKMKYIQVIPLDVTKEESVKQAAATVSDALKEKKSFLTGLVNFHGIGYNGPLEYMPMSLYHHQMEVNFFGNIRMAQAFLPLLKSKTNSTSNFRRIVFTATGGGVCSPCPPLLTAYMSSKFAVEAMAQSLGNELYMTQGDGPKINVSVINPGFTKPTNLIGDGRKLADKMWKMCEDAQGSSIAKDTFGKMLDHFYVMAEKQPATHVTMICKAAEEALTAHSPRSSYKVGDDSKVTPFIGMLPTGPRDWVARHGIYGVLSPAGTLKGYQV